ncbi:MAG: hydroxylamine reductase [Candidatus Aureabacteria bacterium]|nr:hydroxylamine reductase [Candidatus Auribacterota bacterium]
MSMFCYQCEETVNNKGCTIQGVCGKTHDVADLQDLLIYILKGISYYSNKSRELGIHDDEVSSFVIKGLFTTITNVNFDNERLFQLIKESLRMRDRIKFTFIGAYKEKYSKDFTENIPDAASWDTKSDTDIDEFISKGKEVGVLSEANEDIRSLKELIIYGLKGLAAYTDHAFILGEKNDDICAFVEKALATTLRTDLSVDELVGVVMETGKFSVTAMEILDKANTTRYGKQEITEAFTGTKEGPGILISGHDLLDLEEILKQTEDQGINIYTHGEMLPALAYPELKKYKHLIGNYGTAWWNQQKEFEDFNGAIVMTTNCIQKPKSSYKERIFTTGLVAWPEVKHIEDRKNGDQKDFTPVIEKALSLGGLKENAGKKLMIGFSHHTVLSLADKIVEAVKSGAIKRFVVMSGCDGRHKDRNYFTQIAQDLPKDNVILTSGCAKYRYNSLDLGDIGGIPRVLDAGQCNDSYSWAVVALKLKEVFAVDDINDLPISFDIAWYEQKAVTVLLALLYLGFKQIRLGPNLPAFLSTNVLNLLVEKFDIKKISTVENDLNDIAQGK